MTQEHRQAVTSGRPRAHDGRAAFAWETTKNARILQLIEEMGHANVNRFCSASGLNATIVGQLISGKVRPRNRSGQWKSHARRIAEALACEADDLWPSCFARSRTRVFAYAAECRHRVSASTSPSVRVEAREREELIAGALSYLAMRRGGQHSDVIRMRFGLDPHSRRMLLEEIAEPMGVNRERIRQFEAQGIALMRLWLIRNGGECYATD